MAVLDATFLDAPFFAPAVCRDDVLPAFFDAAFVELALVELALVELACAPRVLDVFARAATFRATFFRTRRTTGAFRTGSRRTTNPIADSRPAPTTSTRAIDAYGTNTKRPGCPSGGRCPPSRIATSIHWASSFSIWATSNCVTPSAPMMVKAYGRSSGDFPVPVPTRWGNWAWKKSASNGISEDGPTGSPDGPETSSEAV